MKISRNELPATAGIHLRQVSRRLDGREEHLLDAIASEVPVAFAFNDLPFAVMMASPADLEDFALGFALGEGIVSSVNDVRIASVEQHLEGISISLQIPEAAAARLAKRRRSLEGRSGCGICGSESIEAVLQPPPYVSSALTITPRALDIALHTLHAQQPLNARTGAIHAAGFAAADGTLLAVREDVGRHNALDKLIGVLAREDVDTACGFALVTSRASYEMVMKAARAGIPLLAAISAPTSLAIALAEHANLTLIGFARASGHVVYSHAQRIPHDSGSHSP